MERPHFLRVVQALALVSGFGSVAIVSGASMLAAGASACSSTSVTTGFLASPEFDAGVSTPADSGLDAFTGIITGSQPSCEVNEAGTCIASDASVGGGGIQVAPDAATDAIAVGGPLSPPELPA